MPGQASMYDTPECRRQLALNNAALAAAEEEEKQKQQQKQKQTRAGHLKKRCAVIAGVVFIVVLLLGCAAAWCVGSQADQEVEPPAWNLTQQRHDHKCWLHSLLQATGHPDRTLLEHAGLSAEMQDCIIAHVYNDSSEASGRARQSQHGGDADSLSSSSDEEKQECLDWHARVSRKPRRLASRALKKWRQEQKSHGPGPGPGPHASAQLAVGVQYVVEDWDEVSFYVLTFLGVMDEKGLRDGIRELCDGRGFGV